MLVWYDYGLFSDLINSDNLDDREFQVPRRRKKLLRDELNASFLVQNSFEHFADWGEDPRTSKSKKEQGEDLRTSRETQKRGEDPSTSREQQERGEGPSTSRVLERQHSIRSSLVGKSHSLAGYPSSRAAVDRAAQPWEAFKICEVFFPPRISKDARQHGLGVTEPAAFDRECGWEFFDANARAEFWKIRRQQKPDLVILTPECKPFSQLMNINWDEMDDAQRLRIQTEGLAMLQFCVQVAEHQLNCGRYFLLEQPGGASSWATHSMDWLMRQSGAVRFLFDQCAVGLSVKDNELSKKTIGIVTNHSGIASLLSQQQCSGQHHHVVLEHGLPATARIFPPQLIQTILRGIKFQLSKFENFSFLGEEDEDDGEEEARENASSPPSIDDLPALTLREKQQIMNMHVNMGHLPKQQMLTILKAAGAKPAVLRFVKQRFHCDHCAKQQHPIPRRKAAYPRTFAFSRIVALDYFFVSWAGRTLAFLSMICHGANLQQVVRLENYDGGAPNSKDTWKLFNQVWVRPFGLAEVILTDGGGEFRFEFERAAEQHGLMRVVFDARSPWQNGRVERHGGWAQTRVGTGTPIRSIRGEQCGGLGNAVDIISFS